MSEAIDQVETNMTADPMEAAEQLEARQMAQLGERFVEKSWLFKLADGGDPGARRPAGKSVLQGEDPRLAPMPKRPTLLDFFRYRFSPSQQHLLQSARLAQKNGMPEKMVLACLLHDVGVVGFIRSDHGYWGAQLIEPYVDEEISWAIRMHQALKFFPDEEMGYEYPAMYTELFGENYEPPEYIVSDYKRARAHKWYGSARIICLNDEYAFDPNLEVPLEEFEDIVGRHFKQPAEGLGNDSSPSAHMWRTLQRPCNAL